MERRKMLDLIKDFNLQFNKGGIAGFINKRDKKILILESSNILIAITRVLVEVKNNTFKSKKFIDDFNSLDEFKIFYELDGADNVTRYLLVNKLLDSYKAEGYSLYRPVKFTRFKIKKDLVNKGHLWYIAVKLVNWNREIIVGVFEKGWEVDAFIEEAYPGEVEAVVYANNALTKEFVGRE